MKKILAEIDKLGLKGVELLALVTSTSHEVVFYARVNGKKVQSNSLPEEGVMDMCCVADFYAKVAEIIRGSSEYDPSALNVVNVDSLNNISISKESIDCRVYAIKKNWRAKVLAS